jgi:hypothetical protein
MADQPLFLVSIDTEIRAEDRSALLSYIETDVQLHQQTQKQFGPGWIEFVAFAKDVGILAGAATAMVKLAKEIINWRQARRAETGVVNVNIIFRRIGRPQLKIAEAQDSEILQWFTDK